MSTRNFIAWTNGEVRTFLSIVAEDRIQSELDGATRNEKIFREVSEHMAAQGYNRTAKQCREKLKKMKFNYRAIKDHKGRSGAIRKEWKWYDQMDVIYRHRPASNSKDFGLNTATQLEAVDGSVSTCQGSDSLDPPRSLVSAAAPASEPMPAPSPALPASGMTRSSTGKGKRGHPRMNLPTLFSQMYGDEVRLHEQHREALAQHMQAANRLADEAREAREQAASLQREEMAQTAAFNQGILAVLDKFVNMSGRHV
ncbi:uncharacterized protein KZ484_000138 [Pholidichthys leucotaenia]